MTRFKQYMVLPPDFEDMPLPKNKSYMQKDDPKEHPTKVALRPKIEYYYTKTIRNKKERRATEKRWKKGNKHNHHKNDGHRGH